VAKYRIRPGDEPNGNALQTENRDYIKRPIAAFRRCGGNDEMGLRDKTPRNIKNAKRSFSPCSTPSARIQEGVSTRYEEAVRLFEATHSIGIADSVWEFV